MTSRIFLYLVCLFGAAIPHVVAAEQTVRTSSTTLIPESSVVKNDPDFVPKERYLPNIIINAQLKSGSEHIVTTLRKGLGYRRFDIYSSYEPERHTFYSNINNFYKTDGNIAMKLGANLISNNLDLIPTNW